VSAHLQRILRGGHPCVWNQGEYPEPRVVRAISGTLAMPPGMTTAAHNTCRPGHLWADPAHSVSRGASLC